MQEWLTHVFGEAQSAVVLHSTHLFMSASFIRSQTGLAGRHWASESQPQSGLKQHTWTSPVPW
jgi:hypothetical protein